jgi:hypothetical protein
VALILSVLGLCVAGALWRLAEWDEAEIAALIFDEMGVRPVDYAGPGVKGGQQVFLIPDECVPYMARVRSIRWQSLSETDLVALATSRGEDFVYLGEVSFRRASILEMRAGIGNCPRQVKGSQRLGFLCGGWVSISVRKNLWHLLGIGPKYRFRPMEIIVS